MDKHGGSFQFFQKLMWLFIRIQSIQVHLGAGRAHVPPSPWSDLVQVPMDFRALSVQVFSQRHHRFLWLLQASGAGLEMASGLVAFNILQPSSVLGIQDDLKGGQSL